MTRDPRPVPGPFRGHFRSSKREPERDRKWVSEWTSKGTENGLLKGPKTRISKTDSKCLFSKKLCNIASYRVASHRVALTFDEDYKAFKKQKQGRPEYLLQRTPPLKSFRCIHSGLFITEAAWTL